MKRLLALALPVALLGSFVAPSPAAAEAVVQVKITPHLAPNASEVPGEIAVDLRDDVSEEDATALAKEYGLSLSFNSGYAKSHDKIEKGYVEPSEEASILDRLSKDARVEHALPMHVVRETKFVPNDPQYKEQWHMPRVGAETAWEYGCGMGVTVAVIDTGVACYDGGGFTKGTDLAGTRCGGGWNFVDDTDTAADDEGHGTHVAGTIAQTTNNGTGVSGLAYCARLMPVKVLNGWGWGTTADVAEGVRYAADEGAQVINLSLGSDWPDPLMEDAIAYAKKKNVVIVAAAGNSGGSVGYPAAYDGVIAVSATDSNDQLAWFSSRGKELAIAAPGVEITQQTICNGGQDACMLYDAYSGTSMASPHVAGAAAIVIGMGVTDPADVRAVLTKTAVAKDDPKKFGAGILDVGHAAVRSYWTHVALRVIALVAVGWWIASRAKKRGGKIEWKAPAIVGAVVSGVGLLAFAPIVGLAARAGSVRWLVEVLMRPFGEWDSIASASLHRWLPLANALPSLALIGVLLGTKKGRGFAGGFALGSAALLTQYAISGDQLFAFGGFALRLWTLLNAVVCVFVARTALDTKN